MCRIKNKYKVNYLADPAELFSLEDFSESSFDEYVAGTYYLSDMSGRDAYFAYGQKLSERGFTMRLSLEHASFWVKNAGTVVMEFGELKGKEFLRIVFVKAPKQNRIYLETNKAKLFSNDYKKNEKLIRLQHFKPYYLRLSYSGMDFCEVNFKRVLLRFADFFRCDFKSTSWHACKFHLSYDGRDLFCVFRDCDFSGSNFLGVDFSRCQFFGCNFSGCTFRNCMFDGTIMDNCVLEDFDMIRCKTDNLFIFYPKTGGEEDA